MVQASTGFRAMKLSKDSGKMEKPTGSVSSFIIMEIEETIVTKKESRREKESIIMQTGEDLKENSRTTTAKAKEYKSILREIFSKVVGVKEKKLAKVSAILMMADSKKDFTKKAKGQMSLEEKFKACRNLQKMNDHYKSIFDMNYII